MQKMRMDKLQASAQKAKDDFNDVNNRIQAIDTRLGEITALQKQIGVYSKTREVYATYRKAGYSKKYLAEHEDDITAHKAAKKFFDGLGLKKLPTINMLKTEYSALAAEKKTLYGGYHQARKYMQDILTARQNAEALLGLTRGSSGAGNRAGLTVAAPTFFSVRHERAADAKRLGGMPGGGRFPSAGLGAAQQADFYLYGCAG